MFSGKKGQSLEVRKQQQEPSVSRKKINSTGASRNIISFSSVPYCIDYSPITENYFES